MADLSILFSGLAKRTEMGYQDNQDNFYGILQLDATLSEEHTFSSTITKNEIEEPEDGETNQINDNMVLNPDQLKLEGIISEVPISLIESLKNVGAGLVSNVSGVLGGAGAFLSTELMASPENKQQKALEQILSLLKNKIPFTVVTGLKTYKDMMATSFSVPKDSLIGDSLKFSIQLQKIKFVKSDVVAIPKSVLGGKVKHTASSKQNLGKQATSKAANGVSGNGETIANKMFGGLF